MIRTLAHVLLLASLATLPLGAADTVEPPKPTLPQRFANTGLTADQLAGHYITSRYGLAVLTSGAAILVSSGGTPLLKLDGFYTQGASGTAPDVSFHFHGFQLDQKATVTTTKVDGNTVITAAGSDDLRTWTVTYTCKREEIRVAQKFEITKAFPADQSVSMWLNINGAGKENPITSKAGEWPVQFKSKIGAVSVTADLEHRDWYKVPGFRTDGGCLFINLADTAGLAVGAVIEASYTVAMP